MPDNRPEELQGWPKSWYVNGDEEKGYLRCPVSGCNEVFQTAEQVRNILEHAVRSRDDPDLGANANWDIKFRHKILVAMFNVTACPRCDDPFEFDSIPEIRNLFDHESEVHKTEDLSDINKFITLIRELREKEFGEGREIWPELYEYYKRQLRRQDGYLEFERYLKRNYPLFRTSGTTIYDWYYDQLAVGDRGGISYGRSKEEREKYSVCYPVKSDEYLSLLKPLPDDPEHILNVFKDRYSKGHF